MKTAASGALCVLVLTACTWSPATAGVFFVECEGFSNSHNLGGSNIEPAGCLGASNGIAVVGVDVSGEWIEVDFNAPLTAAYTISLVTNSPALQATAFTGTVVGSGLSTTFEFLGLGEG